MLLILIRTIILYFVVLIVIRAMGKAELSKMDPFDMIVLFMIAELAAIPIESLDIPLLHGAVAIITLLFLQVTISFISTKSQIFSDIINGKPSIIISGGSINKKAMKNQRITIDDLMQQLRLKNYPSLSDVDYAVLEANGELSVIPKPDKAPLTTSDMSVKTSRKTMPMVLISDGKLYDANLKALGKEESFLKKELSKVGITDYAEIFLCFCDEKGALHVFPEVERGEAFSGEVSLK